MGQVCARDTTKDLNDGSDEDEEHEGVGKAQFNGLDEEVKKSEEKTKNIKKRKPTGRKVKKKSKVDLDAVNKNFEISQEFKDPNSEYSESGKLSKVRFVPKEELKAEKDEKLTSKIKRKVTGKRRKSKEKIIDIALINKNYEMSQNDTSPKTFEEMKEETDNSTNVQDHASTQEIDGDEQNMDKTCMGQDTETTATEKEENTVYDDLENKENVEIPVNEDQNHAKRHESFTDIFKRKMSHHHSVKTKSKIPKLKKQNDKKQTVQESKANAVKHRSFIPKLNRGIKI